MPAVDDPCHARVMWVDVSVFIDPAVVDVQYHRREVGMIFQDFNLFDHLTAVDNITIALRKVKKISRKEAQHRARGELQQVDLPGGGQGGPQAAAARAPATGLVLEELDLFSISHPHDI